MLKPVERPKTRDAGKSEHTQSTDHAKQTTLKEGESARDADMFRGDLSLGSQELPKNASILTLPSRGSLKPGHEDQLSYFIGSNVLDTHVQMFAEIESDKNQTIAILYRDEKDTIQTHLEKKSESGSWYFSKESLLEVIQQAKEELAKFPDTKIVDGD